MEPTPDLDLLLEQISELEEKNANLLRLERAIHRNSQLFEALLGASHDGITLTGPDGRIVRVVRGLLGYPPKSMNGMLVGDLIHPEDRGLFLGCYRDFGTRRTRQAIVEARLLKADGTWLWAEFVIRDMLDDPDVMAIVLNYRDISWRKPAGESQNIGSQEPLPQPSAGAVG